jgi:PKD repeat protein/sugar lactone lactonase YvrE
MKKNKMIALSTIFLSALLLICPVMSQSTLDGPETIVYDSIYDRYLVSNMNTNRIVGIDRIGNYSVFCDQANHPYGMTISGNTLYCGGDVGSQGCIWGFDLTTGERVFRVCSPTWFYSINGLTSDASGNIYFACTGQSLVYKVNTADSTSTPIAGIPIPNAIHYDARNNRLLVTTNNWGTQLYLVDLADYSITTVPTVYGQFSGLTEDALHNIYIAYFAAGNVYRIDSALNGPMELISTGHSGPEGICFDQVHSVLCVPNLLANTISLIPQDGYLWSDIDTIVGEVPFDIQCTGSSILAVSEWIWDFGDGDSSFIQSPIHAYEIPGYYDVILAAITATNDTLKHVYPQYISCLADTLRCPEVSLMTDEITGSFETGVDIYAVNNVPINELIIPIEYMGELDLTFDSVTTQDCRTEQDFMYQIIEYSSINKRLSVKVKPKSSGMLYLNPGDGPVLKAFFHVTGPTGQNAQIALDGYGTTRIPEFSARYLDYEPAVRNGKIIIAMCGDSNSDISVNVSDAVWIINYVFVGGDPPDPLLVGDVNCDSSVNVSDAVWIINYVFVGGNDPCDFDGDEIPDC